MCHVRYPRSALAGGFGSPGFAGETSSSQSTSNALPAVAFEDALVLRVGSFLPSGALVPGGERGFVLVDGEGPSSQRGSIRDTCPRSTPVFGRVPDPQAVFEDAFRHPWDNLDLYAFPPFSSGRMGGGSSQRDPQSLHDSGRPPLAREGVVRRPSPSTDPTTSDASVVGPVVVAAPIH